MNNHKEDKKQQPIEHSILKSMGPIDRTLLFALLHMEEAAAKGKDDGNNLPAQLDSPAVLTATTKVMATMNTATQKTTDQTAQKNVEIDRSGDRIIIPPHISLKDARTWLQRQEEAEEQRVSIHEVIEAFPLEGALAFSKAIAQRYGFSQMVPTPGWFSAPPYMVGVTIDAKGTTVQVPWGNVQIPGIEGHLTTGFEVKDNRLCLCIGGVVKGKNKHEVAELVQLTKDMLRTDSIYRGKAIRVNLSEPDSEGDMTFDPLAGPRFMDIANVREEELIFAKRVELDIAVSVFTPIERTATCRTHQIPLKRGILLEGPYGVGKTLTAYMTAKKCVENGWTFIYLDNIAALKTAIHFAKAYEPAVIFAEDIDSVMEAEEDRSAKVDQILNTIDGVDTKGQEIIVILTTNHVGTIEPAMMRPGRLDAVITVMPPDADAAIRLVNLYARGTLDPDSDMTAVGQKLAGLIPAVIREVVERSKLSAIYRNKGATDLIGIQAEDLDIAVEGMRNQLEHMKPRAVDTRSHLEKAASILVAGFSRLNNTPAPNGQNERIPADRGSTRLLTSNPVA